MNDFTSDSATQALSAARGKWLYTYKANARCVPKVATLTTNQDVTIDLGFDMRENNPVILILGFYNTYTLQYTDVYLLSGWYGSTVFATRLINTTSANATRHVSGGGSLYTSEPTITFSRSSSGTISITINSAYSGNVYIDVIG